MATAPDTPSAALDDDAVIHAVEVLLSAAGLNPPDADVAALARAYPGLSRRVQGLYRVPTGDDSPALAFQAELER